MRKKFGALFLVITLTLLLCSAAAMDAYALSMADIGDGYLSDWEEYGKPETGLILFNEGTYILDPKYGLRDAQGKTILAPVYESIQYAAGKLIVSRFGRQTYHGPVSECALMDLQGNILYGFSESSIELVDQARGLFAIGPWEFGVGSKLQLYDSNLNLLIPNVFQEIEPRGEEYPNDYWLTTYDSNNVSRLGLYRYGVGMIFPCKYRSIYTLDQNLYGVRNDNNQWGVITEKSQQILPFAYYSIEDYQNGYFIVSQMCSERQRYGIVDSNNQIVIPIEYDSARFLDNGNARVGMKTGETVFSGVYINDWPLYDDVYAYTDIELEKPPFADVAISTYFCEPVQWAVDQNIAAGTSANLFSPNADCTQAQILTFLWRASGSPVPATENPFANIKNTDYYYNAVVWAYEQGILTDTTFQPDTPCTRSTTMLYLWKWSGAPMPTTACAFRDVAEEAPYCDAVAWAAESGISVGTGADRFEPEQICSRAQIITFLYRAMSV